MSSLPSVTIGIPVLNEELHIEGVVNGFLDAEYSNLVEVLIADGGSTDKTREIVRTLSEKDARVKLIDNPEKYQSFALNNMIEMAMGEIFLRADGHAKYAADYLPQCVQNLVESGARNVGGAQRYLAENRVQAGMSVAMRSALGSGNAKYKRKDYKGYADTVFLGCFWTSDLKEIGGFNETNITSQDLELNLRLKRKFGDKSVFISPDIKCYYYPRDSYLKVLKQYFKHARGRFVTIQIHHSNDEFRGTFPSIFLVGLIIYVLIDLFSQMNLYALHLLAFLFLILVLESIRASLKTYSHFKEHVWTGSKKAPGRISNILSVIPALICMQIGHFTGFMYQFFRTGFGRKKIW